MTQASIDIAELVRSAVAAHRHESGPLLVILHDIQRELGYVDPACVPILAEELNVSRADVHGVVSFYDDFRDRPAGRSTVRICRAEACQAMGAQRMATHAQQRLGIDFGQTTADGATTLEQVFCLGNCALGPAVEVDGRLHGRVDEQRFDELVGGNPQ